MALPIIAVGAGIAARAAAKKAAQEAAKKVAAKAATKAASKGYGMGKKGLTVSNNVRVKPSANSSKLNVNRGAKQAISENLKTAGKATKAETKANARALKAAKGPSLASKSKKLEAVSGRVDRVKTKMKAETNLILGQSRKEAFGNAAKAADKQRAAGEAILKARVKAAKIAKATKNTK